MLAKTRTRRRLGVVVLFATLIICFGGQWVLAEETEASNDARAPYAALDVLDSDANALGSDTELSRRLAALEHEVALLRSQADAESAYEAIPEYAPSASTPEAATFPTVRITGVFQLDAGWFGQDSVSIDTFGDIENDLGFRRARLGATGDVAENTSYLIEFDFAAPGRPSFMDVWLELHDIRLLGNVRVGHARAPFGMAELSSVRELPFLERPLLLAFAPLRQSGIGFHRTLWDESATLAMSGYAFAADVFGDVVGDRGFGAAMRATKLLVDQYEGRMLLHMGGDYSMNRPHDEVIRYRNVPEYGGPFVGTFGNEGSVPAFVDTQPIDASHSNLFNTELALVLGSFHMQTEARYAIVEQLSGQSLIFSGTYVEALYILTGEVRPYNHANGVLGRIKPLNPFTRCGGCGAWEIGARYSYIDLNDGDVLGGRLSDVTLGVNWYLNNYTKFQLNYIRAMLDAPSEGESDTNIVAVRAQLDF